MKKRTVVTLIVLFLVIAISVILILYCREVYKFIAMACGGWYIGCKCNKLIDWICEDNNANIEETKQYKEGFYDGYRSFANKFYSAFREHHKMYKDDALVRMGDVVKLIVDVKNEVYENDRNIDKGNQ